MSEKPDRVTKAILPDLECIDDPDYWRIVAECVDLQLAPFWIIGIWTRNADGLAELEQDAIIETGVAVDRIDGLPPSYRSAADCQAVADAMMRKRPDLHIAPCGSA